MGATATAKRQDVADLMKQFVDGGIAARQAIDSHAGSVTDEAIAKAAPPARLEEKFFQIRVDSLRASTTNPRKRFEPAHLEDLAASIRERGVLQPLLVRPAATPKDARPGLSDVYEIDAAGVQRAMAALSLVPEDGFTSTYFTYSGKRELAALYAAGKKVGVDVKRLERGLAAEKKRDGKRLAKAHTKVRTSAKAKRRAA